VEIVWPAVALLLVELCVTDSTRGASDVDALGLEDIDEKPLLISAVPENGAWALEPKDEGAEEVDGVDEVVCKVVVLVI
jgi:hypothetical protein